MHGPWIRKKIMSEKGYKNQQANFIFTSNSGNIPGENFPLG